jgi:hypothetical protein
MNKEDTQVAKIEKRHVVMIKGPHRAEDYVPVDILDAYVEDAKTRWEHVIVGDAHNPGPAGDEGATVIPRHLAHAAPKHLQHLIAEEI